MQTLSSNHDLVQVEGRRPWQQPAVVAERPLFADAQGIGTGDRLSPAPVFSPLNTSVTSDPLCGGGPG